MYEKDMIYNSKIEKEDIGGGILMQYLGQGENMNVLHWNMEDKSVVDWHEHPQEQFGYVIKGGFKIYMGDEEYKLETGDAYFVPPNTQHRFVAVGKTEAIDVFNPVKKDIPGKNKN
ncbi:MAG: cupin domain-containing protein [Bacillota bacterium]